MTGREVDVATPQVTIAPVAKRKRRASCLGEQERRERKRAIDREAQRSLREKTKAHIADLERTILILRNQDRNVATASLLSEIDVLRAENERLRDVIDNVKNVLGCELLPRNNASASLATSNEGRHSTSPYSSHDQRSPKMQTISIAEDSKPALPVSVESPTAFEFQRHVPKTNTPLDIDGMTVLTGSEAPTTIYSAPTTDLILESGEETAQADKKVDDFPWGDSPASAAFGPMMAEMAEIYGLNWRCPSPIVLHIGAPEPDPSSKAGTVCPVWKKSNEIFGKVFSYRSTTTSSASSSPSGNSSSLLGKNSAAAEAGLLFLGIKEGWDKVSNEWMQSPALVILEQTDELLFRHLPNIDRLAIAYKSLKLLQYYLNATDEQLEKVPAWLRPTSTLSSISHPIAIDFFPWPALRSRLLNSYATLASNSVFSTCYSDYVRFDWPFTFEDAFFLDRKSGLHVPSPLFERFHRDLKYWLVDEKFYNTFPEMRSDIEDGGRFS